MELFVDPIALWLIASRLSGWLLFTPGFTEVNTPQLARAGLVIWLSFLLLPMVGPVHLGVVTLPGIIVILITEFIVGAGYGLMLQLIFSTVQFGGTMIDSEMGYHYAQQVNPFAPATDGVFSRLFILLSILYFWIFDYFRVVIAALHQSFLLIPLGSLDGPSFDVAILIRLAGALFAGGLTIAAPLMALMFFVNVTVGFLARTVSGLNLFSEIFIYKIVVGLIGMLVLLPLFFLLIRVEMEKIIPFSSQYFKFSP